MVEDLEERERDEIVSPLLQLSLRCLVKYIPRSLFILNSTVLFYSLGICNHNICPSRHLEVYSCTQTQNNPSSDGLSLMESTIDCTGRRQERWCRPGALTPPRECFCTFVLFSNKLILHNQYIVHS